MGRKKKPPPDMSLKTCDEDDWIAQTFGLSDQERVFANWFFSCGVGSYSAKQAGYSGGTAQLSVSAHAVKNRPRVKAYLEYLHNDRMGANLTDEWIVQKLVLLSKNRKESGATRVRALELLARIRGLLDKDQSGSTTPVPIILRYDGEQIYRYDTVAGS